MSGVNKKERRKRAKEALNKVGLGEQIHKKPNQLSGGQMQRVAIARAIVNDPSIILADEPTGALDSKTSKQVMDILKEISKDRLVIMVTHNKELAEEYSSRIIKILDGVITDDSNPCESKAQEKNTEKEKRRTSMKFLTALNLSLNNLMTKKGRTILTAFAGSIGIIGIALILSLSTGIQNYINKVEEDTLSSYPISIEEATIDTSSMLETMMQEDSDEEENTDDGKIHSQNIMTEMLSTISNKVENNNLTEFKKYLESNESDIKDYTNSIQYEYNLNLNLYKEDTSSGIVKVNPSTVMEKLGMGAMAGEQQNGISFMNTDVWTKMLDNEELLHSQYDLLAGQWPKNYNEVVLIVDGNNRINDYVLYSLGIKEQNELENMMGKLQNGETVEEPENTTYTYDELLDLSFKIILNTDYYEKENGLWVNKQEDEEYMKEKINEAENIKVVGIIKQNENSAATSMAGGIGYIKDLEEYVINKTNESQIVKEQKENETINVFTGLEFSENEEEQVFNMQNLSQEQQIAISQMSPEEIADIMETYRENSKATYESNLEKLGAVNIEEPTSILIYPKTFDDKERISNAIEEYNKKQQDEGKEENVITYTDLVGTMMKSVTNIIDAVSYALIAFVSISLVVSSIMIGIITYISVLERTKEIGILRAIGASKKDISKVFNAETFIVGLIAGLIGIGITIALSIPINSLIYALSGVAIKATLEPLAGLILVLISMFLTIIAGLIPAKMASKKDPVEALRTE